MLDNNFFNLVGDFAHKILLSYSGFGGGSGAVATHPETIRFMF
jgi:hypothetical protein